MGPDRSQWRSSSSYDFLDTLGADGLAWECLRRNTDYQTDFAAALTGAEPEEPQEARLRVRWGLRFRRRPETSAIEEPVYWALEVDTGVVTLAPAPNPRAASGPPFLHLDAADARPSAEGWHMILQRPPWSVSLLILADPRAASDLCVVIPFDAAAPDRIAAATRLLRLCQGLPAPDGRVTEERRRRLRLMLRAVDGRACGASLRDIAIVLFGARRVSAEDWASASLRYATQRLARDGRAMVQGGYRDLLRHRRRS